MKLLLFLLFPVFSFAQSFLKLDSIAFSKQVDILVKTTGKDFVLSKMGKDQTVDYLIYKSSEETLLITYYTVKDGENKNLNVAGVKRWNLRSIKGNYLTLFPVWQKFVDTSADKDKISKEGYKMKGDFSFKELDSPVWLLRF
ncbi:MULTISPECIES: hypothetical protein [Chryseobacterium]|uniref:Uncharacterized protein n=1 Tax=Candidatus Chryseobacterium massiliense TaxID=204089 RepID=A0A3D9B3D5_9FLAO|nr:MULTISPECIES: hypothetical protein [Chryseobacterium]REC47858.1 hypothetical protein DRF68_12515 [Candidatus Chryseobacterium massiliae]